MIRIVVTSLVVFLACLSHAWGAGDPERGKEKAIVCIGCHGVDGNSLHVAYPKLAGQLEGYIFKQTLDFKEGRRKDAVMSGMISVMPDEDDLKDIAAYYASQETMQGPNRDSDLIKEGEEIFVRERCHFCHGRRGKNQSSLATPPAIIGGQHKQYLVKSLNDIRDGHRTGDMYGLMVQALNRLSTEEVLAVCEYLSNQ
ncbi:MAG: cytochrome c4 [Pseudomonadales bacterium]|nr:cytochrome c4 [Pseudomonadales bacterium]